MKYLHMVAVGLVEHIVLAVNRTDLLLCAVLMTQEKPALKAEDQTTAATFNGIPGPSERLFV
jgi:hypothetical protein